MTRRPRRYVRCLLGAAAFGAVLVTLACGNPRAAQSSATPLGDTSADRNLQTEDPAREMEVVVLENYLQLSLGNIEAYADSIARDREVMLVGVGPDGTAVGAGGRMEHRDRRPLRARPRCMEGARKNRVCIEVVSKRLDVHLYDDQSVGWLSDEISYRLPVDGRNATMPLRVTAVLVRDIDRWTVVLEHTSYALSMTDIVRLARAGALPPVTKFDTKYAGPKNKHVDVTLARDLVNKLVKHLNASADERASYRDAMQRKYAKARAADDDSTGAGDGARQSATNSEVSPDGGGDGRPSLKDKSPRFVGEETLVTLMPTRRDEYHDDSVHGASSLAQLFGEGTKVSVRNYRYDRAENRRVAWILGNLVVETRDPASGRPMAIELRGTFLYAFDRYSGWNLVQRHISVPISDEILADRVIGRSIPTAPE